MINPLRVINHIRFNCVTVKIFSYIYAEKSTPPESCSYHQPLTVQVQGQRNTPCFPKVPLLHSGAVWEYAHCIISIIKCLVFSIQPSLG